MSVIIKNPDKPKKETHRDVRTVKEYKYPKDAYYSWIEYDAGYHIQYPESQYCLLQKDGSKWKAYVHFSNIDGYHVLETLAEAFRYVDLNTYDHSRELWLKTRSETVLNVFDSDIDDYIR